MKLLLISNSTNAGEPYLKYPMPRIDEFLGSVREVVFVPYAGITFSYAEYEAKVQARFAEYGIKVRSVHRSKDPRRMIREAQAICVGGGNTFALTKKMQEQGLLKAILGKIKAGTPYIGWSAGSNVCCPTICTTNDMPIVEPESFKAIGAVKFQINPHYLDAGISGHMGETRDERLAEFCAINPSESVVALREASLLQISGDTIEYWSARGEGFKIFKHGEASQEFMDAAPLAKLTPFTPRI